MKRREFITLLGSAIACTPATLAQQPSMRDKPFRIATLPDPTSRTRDEFLGAMRDLGWREGRDYLVAQTGAQIGEANFDEAANRVVASIPDLILTLSTAYALAARRATKTIPIVMLTSGYPVEAGLADSLATPGKNVTGNTIHAGTGVWAKLVQLLLEARPSIRRISVLWTYVPPAAPKEEVEPCYAELRNAESSLGVTIHIIECANSQAPAALAQIDTAQPDALLLTSALTISSRTTVMNFAVRKRLPTITDVAWVPAPEPYPLLTYGPALSELIRTTAAYVDKIMKGAKPGELPIQRPAKFAMTVNLKTARAIELTIPPSLLARADEVIE